MFSMVFFFVQKLVSSCRVNKMTRLINCINYPLVHNKWLQNLTAENSKCLLFHTVFKGQTFRSASSGSLIRLQARYWCCLTSRLDWGWRVCFQVHVHGCWLDSVPHWLVFRGLSSLPPWPPHRLTECSQVTAAGFPQGQWAKREPVWKPQSFTT